MIRSENTEKRPGDGSVEDGNKTETRGGDEEVDSEQEGLAVLLPDIQTTASLVLKCTAAYRQSQESRAEHPAAAANSSVTGDASLNADEHYLAVMKPLQFGEFITTS